MTLPSQTIGGGDVLDRCEHKWKIWVCPHGYRVEWQGDKQANLHMDADGQLCDETVMTLIEPRNDRGAVSGDGPGIVACENCAYSGATVGHAGFVRVGERCAYCKGGKYVMYSASRGAVDHDRIVDLENAATLLEEVGTDDFVNPPTAEAMQAAAVDLRRNTSHSRGAVSPDFARRLAEQADEAAQKLIERNAEIKRLRTILRENGLDDGYA